MMIKRLILKLPLFVFGLLSVMANEVTSFTLINSSSDTDIDVLTDGDTIVLSETGNDLNIRANVDGEVNSVIFDYNGTTNYVTENVAPYALFGDNSGDYDNGSFSPETYNLTARPFDGEGGGGTEGTSLSIAFVVVNENADNPDPDPDPPADTTGTGEITMDGELRKWHKITLSLNGPYAEENGDTNPFSDYRLYIVFTNGGESFTVPGYFAADGDAAESGAQNGNIWRVHFSPNKTGTWNYEVHFEYGNDLAISDLTESGTPIDYLHGETGSFNILGTNKNIPDNRARGRLQYISERYLKYAETQKYFVKGGADSPENLLAYEDFDNTPDNGGRRKSWSPHASDWNTGDPSWNGGDGTEIIGAVNYLASKGMNAFSFLTMNIDGDDDNVFPYINSSTFDRFDCSKLDQWEILFEHADSKGMYLHFKTQETENDDLLNDGDLGRERKLYYRELVARFGHHLALNWNLGEENTQSTEQRQAMAAYFNDLDPYDHHIVMHTYPGSQEGAYRPLLGTGSELTGASIQISWHDVYEETAQWIEESVDAGQPWVVANDEQGSANTGVPPDPGWPGYGGSSPDQNGIRKETLWGNLMAGGGGVEYYFGYGLPENDLNCEDFRSRDQMWDYTRYALQFFRNYLPFHDMQADNDLTDDGWCFAKEDSVYAIYLQNGGSTTLNLNNDDTYEVFWYNPRTGEGLLKGSVDTIVGPGEQNIGDPPSDSGDDWTVLVRVKVEESEDQNPNAEISASKTTGEAPLTITFDSGESSDPDGTVESFAWTINPGNTEYTTESAEHTFNAAGTYTVSLVVTDNDDLTGSVSIQIEVTDPAEPQSPTANISASTTSGEVPLTVNFNGSGSNDPDGSITGYSWNFGDGNAGSGVSVSHTFNSVGTYTVELEVIDNDGLTDTDEVDITVSEPAPKVPEASIDVMTTSGEIPFTIEFDGSGSSDADGTISTYEWDFGDGNTGSGATVSHTYETKGNYTVELTVTDNDGLTDTDEIQISAVEPGQQAPEADINVSTTSGIAPLTVNFDGSGSSDPDGTIENYLWDFGDGNTGLGEMVSNTFTKAGSYKVTLTVVDNDDISTEASVDITVTENNTDDKLMLTFVIEDTADMALSEAWVEIMDETLTTNNLGEASIEVNTNSKLTFQIGKDQYQTVSDTVNVNTDDVTLSYHLVPVNATSILDQRIDIVKIYPNPAKNVIFVENITRKSHLYLYDNTGKLLKQMVIQNNVELNVNNLPHGLYFVRLIDMEKSNPYYHEMLIIE